MSKISFIYVTAPNAVEAESIGRTLLDERLAACINIFPQMKSVYWWEGKLDQSDEAVLIVKTTPPLVKKAIERISKIHPYDCPCAIEIPLGTISTKYESWISTTLRVSSKKSPK